MGLYFCRTKQDLPAGSRVKKGLTSCPSGVLVNAMYFGTTFSFHFSHPKNPIPAPLLLIQWGKPNEILMCSAIRIPTIYLLFSIKGSFLPLFPPKKTIELFIGCSCNHFVVLRALRSIGPWVERFFASHLMHFQHSQPSAAR